VDTLSAALSYAARGWAVFAISAKAPFRHSRGLLDATTSKTGIREGWRRHPKANVAIRTGRQSGLVVLDVDPRHGGDDALYELEREYAPLPTTPEVRTGGGGRHIYFRAPVELGRKSESALGDGLDVRAEGAYVVAPPSAHPSGGCYEWEVSGHPDDVPLAEIPGWLLALMRKRKTSKRRGPGEAKRQAWQLAQLIPERRAQLRACP